MAKIVATSPKRICNASRLGAILLALLIQEDLV